MLIGLQNPYFGIWSICQFIVSFRLARHNALAATISNASVIHSTRTPNRIGITIHSIDSRASVTEPAREPEA